MPRSAANIHRLFSVSDSRVYSRAIGFKLVTWTERAGPRSLVDRRDDS